MNSRSHRHVAVKASYPAPTVKEAPAGILLPGAVTNRVTIVTPTLTGLPPGAKIEIAFVFGDYLSAPVPYKAGMSFAFPAKELGIYLGTHVLVGYNLTIDGVTTPSERMDLYVMAFDDRAPLLPAPVIDQANGGVLDLTTFSGDPTATCPPWKLGAVGQRAWWEVHGTLNNGAAEVIVLYSNYALTDDEVSDGLTKTVDRARLEALKDGSTITVTFWVTFDKSGDKAKAIAFPGQTYIVWQATPLPRPVIDKANGIVLDLDTFAGAPRVTCPPWAGIAEGQIVWLDVDGVLADGRAHVITIYRNAPVVDRELTQGLITEISRKRLEVFKNNSTITVKLWVNFSKSYSKPTATAFPERSYTIRGSALG